MKTYLVGGSVRDLLLKEIHGLVRETGDRDWVVVGAQAAELARLGFHRVGQSFPVYLHPDTKEEYALARDSDGGFSPEVTLEDDLGRRDLTINAMALTPMGDLIDPYGGRQDIEQKVLRHLEGAFDQDPLRILRVARFAAQLADFTVAPETLQAMRETADSGALEGIVAERLFNELHKALAAPEPEHFVRVLHECGVLAVILPEVDCLFGVVQPEKYHPEVDTGEHVCLALRQIARLAPGNPRVAYAVLLHDLGKGLTPVYALPSHHGHEGAGVPLVTRISQRLRVPNRFRRLAEVVCEFHLHMHRLMDLKPSTIAKLLEATRAYRDPGFLDDFCLACQADALGRGGCEDQPYPQSTQLQAYATAARQINSSDLQAQGYNPGPAMGEALKAARVRAIKQVKTALLQEQNSV